ncbi:hypothetical protein BN946_scf184671.g9 [Trametes cinnabarina]|uniref:Uncharacterized protein n=1 Tax=Pycnoporus cinnabarinus TaxID=5643 RepID=A0A060SKE7_PYCCI|nr:hypothetical protein BN946_scf184671.g9 [Trametes cinnabarina]
MWYALPPSSPSIPRNVPSQESYSEGYCSPQCAPPPQSSSKAYAIYPSSANTSSHHTEPDDLDFEVCHIEDCSYSDHPAPSSHNTWIGQGDAGILAWAQSVPAGAPSELAAEPSTYTKRPKLLEHAGSRVKPSLYMSRAQPAAPEPSRPILTPQQSLPSLSRGSNSIKSTSLVSLATGSSSYSLATPATGSVVGSLAPHDTSRQVGHKSGLLGGLKAHLRVLTAAAGAPIKEKQHRSSTVTRRDSETGSIQSRPQKSRRAPSPVAFYNMPEQYAPARRKEVATRPTTKESGHPSAAVEEYSTFRTRGRKPSRYAS